MKVIAFFCPCSPDGIGFMPGRCNKCYREKEITQQEIDPRKYCQAVGHNDVSLQEAREHNEPSLENVEGEGYFCLRCKRLKSSKPHESPSDCFLTTACVQAQGLNEDCFELQTLRRFRDTYIIRLPNGHEAISEYYSVGPKVVRAISAQSNAAELYYTTYQTVILPCVELINRGSFDKAYKLYGGKVRELQTQFKPSA